MKAIIIEDEINVRKGLRQIITAFCDDVEIVGEAGSIKEAKALLQITNCSLVFLDIELPDGSGIEFLQSYTNRNFQVIFVTAYNQYAITAFRLSAIDYLLKPINPEHLMEAVEKAKWRQNQFLQERNLQLLFQNLTQKEGKIILKDFESMHVVKIKDIIYCAADGGYTRFILKNQKEIMTSITLKEYEKMLHQWGFVRSHHSYLVNYNHILRFNKSEGGVLVLAEGHQVPVSSRKKENLLRLLNQMMS